METPSAQEQTKINRAVNVWKIIGAVLWVILVGGIIAFIVGLGGLIAFQTGIDGLGKALIKLALLEFLLPLIVLSVPILVLTSFFKRKKWLIIGSSIIICAAFAYLVYPKFILDLKNFSYYPDSTDIETYYTCSVQGCNTDRMPPLKAFVSMSTYDTLDEVVSFYTTEFEKKGFSVSTKIDGSSYRRSTITCQGNEIGGIFLYDATQAKTNTPTYIEFSATKNFSKCL